MEMEKEKKRKGRKRKRVTTQFWNHSRIHFSTTLIFINIISCTCIGAMIIFHFSFFFYITFFTSRGEVCVQLELLSFPTAQLGRSNTTQGNTTQHEIRNRKRAEQGNLIFLRSASTIKILVSFFSTLQLNSCIAVDTAQVLCSAATAQAPESGLAGTMKSRYSSLARYSLNWLLETGAGFIGSG